MATARARRDDRQRRSADQDRGSRQPADQDRGSRRQRNPRGQGERLREDIIEAASRLLEDPAGRPLSLRGVAREVGVAATSVYLHFDDVESLVRAVASRRFTDIIRTQDAATAGLAGPCERLRAAALAYCEFGLAHPGHYQVTFSNPMPVGDDMSWEQMPGRAAWDHFVEGVAPCIGRKPDHPEAVRTALLLWQQLHGTVTLRISRPRFPWPPLAESVSEAVERLIAPVRPRDPRPA